jgi:uncharacterized protein (TIGR03118 family)
MRHGKMTFNVTIRSAVHAALGRPLLYLAMRAGLLVLLLAGKVPAQESPGRFIRIDLVSTVFGRTPISDSRLVNPWGMANPPDGGPWWVANEGKGRATVYDGAGAPLPGLSPLAVTIPVIPGGIHDDSTPTAVVVNAGGGFEIAPGVPARLIFVTKDGSIAGWNSEVDLIQAVIAVDNSPEAVYTGAAIAGPEGEKALYVANFRQGRIVVYGTDFNPVLLDEFAFVDPLIPSGYAPYNIQNIGGELYVTFAQTRSDGREASYGEGAGYLDIFDTEGNLVLRLEHGPWMNAPWGMALAPIGFGKLGDHLLVGNTGNGRISVFDPATGAYEGSMQDVSGSTLTILGLRGMDFGNDGIAGPETELYFTAGNEGRGQNVFGAIISSSSPPHPALATEFALSP